MANWKFLLIAWVLATATGFCIGSVFENWRLMRRGPIPVSQTALFEINMACSGNYRDLVVNRRYVYANCVGGKPATVQNYEMK